MDERKETPNRKTVRLDCLGRVQLSLDGQPFVLSAGRKGLALMCVLAATPGHRVERERLAALLWGGRFEEQARQSLRQTLSALRRDADAADGNFVDVDREFVAIGRTSTDLGEFQNAISSGEMAAAARLWRGEFAEGVDLDHDAWISWRNNVRAQLCSTALGVFERLARGAAHDADRLSAAENMLKLDSINEIAAQLLLPALVRSRGVASVVSWYDGFADRLRREKGRSPLPETAALYASIVEGRGDRSPATGREAPAAIGLSRRALAACIGAIAIAAGGLTVWTVRDESESEPSPTAAATFIEPAALRWPFRFFVAEPRALDREPATLKAQETLAQDLRNALAVMPGSALATAGGQGDFTMDADIRSGESGRLAINLRLTERATGRILWADTLAGAERYAAGFPEQRAAPIDTAIARAYAALLVEMDRRRPQIPAVAPEVAAAARQGWLALRGGANRQKVDESDAAFRRAYELDPESPDARIGMAHSLAMYLLNGWSERRADDSAAAYRLIAETIDRSARQPIAFFVQGLVHKSQRDYARGLAALRVTLQMQPAHPASYAQSAHMHLLSGDADRALEMAELGVLLGPEANALDRALLYAGMARFLLGDFATAARHLERTFAINRTFADVYAWYAAALYQAGQPDEARDIYRQMRARWPTHRVDHHVLISHAPERMERFTSAIADLEARAELDRPQRNSAN